MSSSPGERVTCVSVFYIEVWLIPLESKQVAFQVGVCDVWTRRAENQHLIGEQCSLQWLSSTLGYMHEWRTPTIRSSLMHDYIAMEPNTYVQSGSLKSTAFRFDKWEVHFCHCGVSTWDLRKCFWELCLKRLFDFTETTLLPRSGWRR